MGVLNMNQRDVQVADFNRDKFCTPKWDYDSSLLIMLIFISDVQSIRLGELVNAKATLVTTLGLEECTKNPSGNLFKECKVHVYKHVIHASH